MMRFEDRALCAMTSDDAMIWVDLVEKIILERPKSVNVCCFALLNKYDMWAVSLVYHENNSFPQMLFLSFFSNRKMVWPRHVVYRSNNCMIIFGRDLVGTIGKCLAPQILPRCEPILVRLLVSWSWYVWVLVTIFLSRFIFSLELLYVSTGGQVIKEDWVLSFGIQQKKGFESLMLAITAFAVFPNKEATFLSAAYLDALFFYFLHWYYENKVVVKAINQLTRIHSVCSPG